MKELNAGVQIVTRPTLAAFPEPRRTGQSCPGRPSGSSTTSAPHSQTAALSQAQRSPPAGSLWFDRGRGSRSIGRYRSRFERKRGRGRFSRLVGREGGCRRLVGGGSVGLDRRARPCLVVFVRDRWRLFGQTTPLLPQILCRRREANPTCSRPTTRRTDSTPHLRMMRGFSYPRRRTDPARSLSEVGPRDEQAKVDRRRADRWQNVRSRDPKTTSSRAL